MMEWLTFISTLILAGITLAYVLTNKENGENKSRNAENLQYPRRSSVPNTENAENKCDDS